MFFFSSSTCTECWIYCQPFLHSSNVLQLSGSICYPVISLHMPWNYTWILAFIHISWPISIFFYCPGSEFWISIPNGYYIWHVLKQYNFNIREDSFYNMQLNKQVQLSTALDSLKIDIIQLEDRLQSVRTSVKGNHLKWLSFTGVITLWGLEYWFHLLSRQQCRVLIFCQLPVQDWYESGLSKCSLKSV